MIIRRYHWALVHHASRVLGDRGLAEDAVQDAWLAAFARIDRFELRSSLFTWLARIVINRARTLRRHEARCLPFSACGAQKDRPAAEDENDALGRSANDASPERLLLEQEAFRRFRDALQALPESQRSVVVLRDLEGASAAETCRVLQINDLTHRVRLCRARASIREAL